MTTAIFYMLIPATIYLGLYLGYVYLHVIVALIYRKKNSEFSKPHSKFAIIIPAHNEELLLGELLSSLNEQDYPINLKKVYVVADNCTDKTSKIALDNKAVVLERTDINFKGKGYAIKYAFEKIAIDEFGAILIVDADSVVDNEALKVLDNAIKKGSKVIQCYNGVGNPDESWFTRLLDVSRTISNMLLGPGKEILGLSFHLQGNGMCFTHEIISRYGWDAFTVGEDFEFYAKIVTQGERVAFLRDARIYHQESRTFKQATSQRMRWSSGRMSIAYHYGISIFMKGLFGLNIRKMDASLVLLFPNPSMALNINVMLIIITIFINYISLLYILVCLLFLQMIIFCIGVLYTDNKAYKFLSIFLVPIFIVWKMLIDIASALGFGRNKWLITERIKAVKEKDDSESKTDK